MPGHPRNGPLTRLARAAAAPYVRFPEAHTCSAEGFMARLHAPLLALTLVAACDSGTSPHGPPPSAIVAIAGDTVLSPGDSGRVSAAVTDSSGQLILTAVTWSALDTTVASIDAQGVITARALGTTYLRASVDHGTDSVALRVAPGFLSLSMGTYATCGIRSDSAAFCWTPGTLAGTSTPNPPPFASLVSGGYHWADIQIDVSAACGVTGDGTGYCWGNGIFGHLGTGQNTGLANDPVPIAGGLTWRRVMPGLEHACGVTTAGAAYCWGRNQSGALGDSTPPVGYSNAPVAVVGGHVWQRVEADGRTACGLDDGGAVYCWGENDDGYLGIDSTMSAASYPLPLTAGGTFAGLTIADIHACALTAAGEAQCWGYDGSGELGRGIVDSMNHPAPASVAGGHQFREISGGQCGLATDSTAWCWGHGYGGTPVQVAGGRHFAHLASGRRVVAYSGDSCGLTAGGGPYCWSDTSQVVFRLRDP